MSTCAHEDTTATGSGHAPSPAAYFNTLSADDFKKECAAILGRISVESLHVDPLLLSIKYLATSITGGFLKETHTAVFVSEFLVKICKTLMNRVFPVEAEVSRNVNRIIQHVLDVVLLFLRANRIEAADALAELMWEKSAFYSNHGLPRSNNAPPKWPEDLEHLRTWRAQLVVSDWVDAMADDGEWYHAQLLAADSDSDFKVRFVRPLGWNALPPEIIPRDSTRFAFFHFRALCRIDIWRSALIVCSKLDLLDHDDKWYTGRVVDIRDDDLLCSFDGCVDDQHSEWLLRCSERLAPHKTRARGGKDANGVSCVIPPRDISDHDDPSGAVALFRGRDWGSAFLVDNINYIAAHGACDILLEYVHKQDASPVVAVTSSMDASVHAQAAPASTAVLVSSSLPASRTAGMDVAVLRSYLAAWTNTLNLLARPFAVDFLPRIIDGAFSALLSLPDSQLRSVTQEHIDDIQRFGFLILRRVFGKVEAGMRSERFAVAMTLLRPRFAPCPTLNTIVTMIDGSCTTVTQPLIDRIISLGFDRIRCDHVAAAVFWITRALQCSSEQEIEHLKLYSWHLLEKCTRACTHDCTHLIAELETAHRIADFVCDDINLKDGKRTKDNFGSIFASWLHGLVPATEAAKIHRPWNAHGVSGVTFSIKDYTPVSFNFQRVSPGADANTSELVAVDCVRLYSKSSRPKDGQKVALFSSCQEGPIQNVRLLLEAGADKDSKDERGYTPLMIAAVKGRLECVRILLEVGADLEAKTKVCEQPIRQGGDTALIISAQYGSTECTRLFLEAGANIEAKNACGETSLVFAAWTGHADCLRLLIQAGANLDAQTNDDFTALIRAAENGKTECVRLLLEAGAEKNVKEYRHSALFLAAGEGHVDCVRLLLEAGADTDAVDMSGDTALMFAVHKGHTECARLLLDAGANKNYMKPISSFMSRGQTWCFTALSHAASDGHTGCLRLLLEAGADKETRSFNGKTPLICSAEEGHADCVRLLLEAGADKNAKTTEGHTPLICATVKGHTECVRHLLDADADKEAKDKHGSTAHDIAQKLGHAGIVLLILASIQAGKQRAQREVVEQRKLRERELREAHQLRLAKEEAAFQLQLEQQRLQNQRQQEAKTRQRDAERGVFVAHRCSFASCQTFDRDIRSAETEFTELRCHLGCLVRYHFQHCWKRVLADRFDGEIRQGMACMTPDCAGMISGAIIWSEFVDKKPKKVLIVPPEPVKKAPVPPQKGRRELTTERRAAKAIAKAEVDTKAAIEAERIRSEPPLINANYAAFEQNVPVAATASSAVESISGACSIAVESCAPLVAISCAAASVSDTVAASVPCNSHISATKSSFASTSVQSTSSHDRGHSLTDTEELLAANRQRKEDQKAENRALQAKRVASKVIKGAPPLQGPVLPAAVSQQLAAVKVKVAASSAKPEPLLPQTVTHPSQLVDTVRALNREDDAVSSGPSLVVRVAHDQQAAPSASSHCTASHSKRLHLDQFLSELRSADPSVSDPYEYRRPIRSGQPRHAFNRCLNGLPEDHSMGSSGGKGEAAVSQSMSESRHSISRRSDTNIGSFSKSSTSCTESSNALASVSVSNSYRDIVQAASVQNDFVDANNGGDVPLSDEDLPELDSSVFCVTSAPASILWLHDIDASCDYLSIETMLDSFGFTRIVVTLFCAALPPPLDASGMRYGAASAGYRDIGTDDCSQSRPSNVVRCAMAEFDSVDEALAASAQIASTVLGSRVIRTEFVVLSTSSSAQSLSCELLSVDDNLYEPGTETGMHLTSFPAATSAAAVRASPAVSVVDIETPVGISELNALDASVMPAPVSLEDRQRILATLDKKASSNTNAQSVAGLVDVIKPNDAATSPVAAVSARKPYVPVSVQKAISVDSIHTRVSSEATVLGGSASTSVLPPRTTLLSTVALQAASAPFVTMRNATQCAAALAPAAHVAQHALGASIAHDTVLPIVNTEPAAISLSSMSSVPSNDLSSDLSTASVSALPVSSSAASVDDNPLQRIFSRIHQLNLLQLQSAQDRVQSVTEQQAVFSALKNRPTDASMHSQLAALIQRQQEQNDEFIALQGSLRDQQVALAGMLSAATFQK